MTKKISTKNLSDDNLISFTGDRQGNIWRNGSHLFGPDVPEHNVATDDRIVTLNNVAELFDKAHLDGRKIADTLKFSGARFLTVYVQGIVPGGYEDCIDVNNKCFNIKIFVPDGLKSNGTLVTTIKGGSNHIHITGPILKGGTTADHGLGNWSDQSREITRNVVLNTPAKDRATTYYQMNAQRPKSTIGVQLKSRFRVRGFWRKAWVCAHGLLKKLGLPL